MNTEDKNFTELKAIFEDFFMNLALKEFFSVEKTSWDYNGYWKVERRSGVKVAVFVDLYRLKKDERESVYTKESLQYALNNVRKNRRRGYVTYEAYVNHVAHFERGLSLLRFS